MKAIMIVYNQTLSEKVEYMLTSLGLRGYTQFNDTFGCGSNTGDPRLGTHSWPELNNVIITIVDDDMVDRVFKMIEKIDKLNEEVGIRAFVWTVERSY
ncbi:MAG: hypothetical protein J6T30_03735 [Bacteroidales bacterium]|nr:hypothetical protein [Bacteroidales bacterium]